MDATIDNRHANLLDQFHILIPVIKLNFSFAHLCAVQLNVMLVKISHIQVVKMILTKMLLVGDY